MPSRFQVHAMTTDGGDKVSYCSDDIPVTPDSDGMVFIQLDASTRAPNSSNLTAYRDYTAWIVTKNDFEESKSTGEIPFSKLVCELLQEAIDGLCMFISYYCTSTCGNGIWLDIARMGQMYFLLDQGDWLVPKGQCQSHSYEYNYNNFSKVCPHQNTDVCMWCFWNASLVGASLSKPITNLVSSRIYPQEIHVVLLGLILSFFYVISTGLFECTNRIVA